jgi:hypothetical protein
MTSQGVLFRTSSSATAGARLYSFISELKSEATPRERRDYLPQWRGFHGVFGLRMRGAGRGCHIELDAAVDAEFRSSSRPHIVLAERLVRAIQTLEATALITMCSSSTFRSAGQPALWVLPMKILTCTITSRPLLVLRYDE